jgi:replicative superfamily II helicase/DNA-binding winged helix-turn-helix (wHTH) protein
MPITIESLTSHGFRPRTVSVWRRGVGETLLPLQEKAIREYGFLHGRDLVVFAPTASGKTFVAELAAMRHLEQRRAVVFLVPTRSLAEEKTREFTARYRELALRIVCSTRERPENDRAVAEGRFDWLVAVYEKFSAHLVSHPEILGRIGLVIADELQMLGDRERGPGVDLLLTKLRRSPHSVQRIALSAVLPDSLRIADWLGADLLTFAERPVDLLEGVVDLASGRFHWRSFNSGRQGCDPIETVFDEPSSAAAPRSRPYPRRPGGEADDEARHEGMIALAQWIVESRGEQVLMFVPTRWMSRSWAEEAARRMSLAPAQGALDALERQEPSLGRDLLARCLRAGTAFHNADLPAALRRLVEDQFRAGSIRLLVSTPTLAQGVNLTGRNVMQVPRMITEDPWTGQPSTTALTRERFCNQGGRAARTGIENRPGRSMVPAVGEAEAERLFHCLVETPRESITPPLDGADLAPALLDLLVSRALRTPDELVEFLLDTYTGRCVWGGGRERLRRRVVEALGRLRAARLAVPCSTDDDGPWETGGLAQATASAALTPETAELLIRWLEVRGDVTEPLSPVAPILAAALTAELRTALPPLRQAEHGDPLLLQELRRRLGPEVDSGVRFLWERVARPTGFTPEDRRAAKLVLLLTDWIGPEETEIIEGRFGVLSGTIAAAGAQAAWIVRAAGALAAALGHTRAPAQLRLLAERIEPGVGEEGVELARLRIEGLGRGTIAAFLREGIRSPRDLFAWPEERLRQLCPPDTIKAILEYVKDNIYSEEKKDERDPKGKRKTAFADEQSSSMKNPGRDGEPQPLPPGPMLVIHEDSPGIVEWAGRRVRLPRLPFRLLLTLARKPGRGVTYRELMDRVWQGQAVVEQQQINFHRRRAVKALEPLLGADQCAGLITTHPAQGMVLNLEPAAVHIQSGPVLSGNPD